MAGADRVALITGSGRGIGRACAVRMAREGFAIGLTARSADQLGETEKAIRDIGGRAFRAEGDITDPADVGRVCDLVTGALGPVDVVVNNAAYPGPMKPFLEIPEPEWVRVLHTNVLGPVHVLRALLPGMLARGRGYIINVNSLQGSDPAGSPLPYGVSKAALMRLTDGLAGQLAGSGVIVMDLSPGLVRTAMTSGRPDLDRLDPSAWAGPQDAAEQLVRLVSGRYDRLHGRFVRAADDLDRLCARLDAQPDARILRLVAKDTATAS